MAPGLFGDQQVKKTDHVAFPVNTTNPTAAGAFANEPTVGFKPIFPANARFTRENLARDQDLARRIERKRPIYGDMCAAEEAYINNPEYYMPCNRDTCKMTHEDQLAWTRTREYKDLHKLKYGKPVDEDEPFGAVLEDAVKNRKFNFAIRKMRHGSNNANLGAMNPQVKALHQDVMNYRHRGAAVNLMGQTKCEAKREREKGLFR